MCHPRSPSWGVTPRSEGWASGTLCWDISPGVEGWVPGTLTWDITPRSEGRAQGHSVGDIAPGAEGRVPETHLSPTRQAQVSLGWGSSRSGSSSPCGSPGTGPEPSETAPRGPNVGHQSPRPSNLLPRGLGSRMRLLWSRISNLTAGPLGRRFRSRSGQAQLSPQVFGDPNRDRAWPGLSSSVLLPAQLGRTVSPPGPIPGGRQSRTGPTITHRNRPNRVATAAEAAAASRAPATPRRKYGRPHP